MSRYDRAYEEHNTRHAGMVYILMLVVAVAFGGFVWNLYSAPAIPRLMPPAGAYKIAPEPQTATAPDLGESYDPRNDAAASAQQITPAPAPEEPIAAAANAGPPSAAGGAPQLGAMPTFVSNGPYLAQLAALQSQPAVDPSWRRFTSRAPTLFAHARLDVERADLGQRGTYYRVRAGYFADRANATRFCERIRQMGQDCIVVAR